MGQVWQMRLSSCVEKMAADVGLERDYSSRKAAAISIWTISPLG